MLSRLRLAVNRGRLTLDELLCYSIDMKNEQTTVVETLYDGTDTTPEGKARNEAYLKALKRRRDEKSIEGAIFE